MATRGISSWLPKLSVGKLMAIISVLYLLTVWLGYRQAEKYMNRKAKGGQIFKPRINQNGKIQLYVKECPIHFHPKHSHLSGRVDHQTVKSFDKGQCQSNQTIPKVDIQMEKEWRRISVGYPQYVYTVSGWIQVIDVPNYTAKSLRVIIVPHSHQDPGWKNSFESYYTTETHKTLDNIVDYLSNNPKWKFIWSEISFLQKWFDEARSKREELKKLIHNGQLEIVTGGWVMTDESVAHYRSMLGQLIEGHVWTHHALGIVPNTSWSVDPFGHSPTMTYMLKESGINKMVIQRAHFGIKRHLSKTRSLEFMWRQAWDSTGKTEVLCHLMPFLLYAILYSCGPDPHVCCQFDFHRDKCFYGTETVPKLTVDDDNIRKLAWALWEQLQKKSELYRSNVLLVPHGDDFRYHSSKEWTEQFGNLEKLMDYMNKNKEMDIQLEFGTISDYFKALEAKSKKSEIHFPTLSGDFLPYNDRDDQYWTGYYSVRPLLKHMTRVLQAKLRLAEILYTLTQAKHTSSEAQAFYSKKSMFMAHARHALGLLQHHDAITGTSTSKVMDSYASALQESIQTVDGLLKHFMVYNLKAKVKKYEDLKPNTVSMAEEWVTRFAHPTLHVNEIEGKWIVIVTNPLTVRWRSAVTVRSRSPAVVKTNTGSKVPSQINPVWSPLLQPLIGLYDIVFEADLKPLSIKTYVLFDDVTGGEYAKVEVFGKEVDPSSFIAEFKATRSEDEMVDIENGLLKASVSTCTGTLQYTTRRSDDNVHKTSIKMVTYGTGSLTNPFRDKSGAYIFMPNGQAQESEMTFPSMLVIQGSVMSSVVSRLDGVLHSVTLYNISGPVETGVYLDNLANLNSPEWNNKELAMRVVSDVVSVDNSVCVDLNGFQMHKKKWKSKFLIQGNFHPVTSMAFIEDAKSRFSLLTSEAHGVASLNQGWLEAILDRRLMQDDWRGLNEGVQDNVFSPSRFILLMEEGDGKSAPPSPVCRPSLLGHLLSTHLDNPPQVALIKEPFKEAIQHLGLNAEVEFLSSPWPCTFVLEHFRSVAQTLLNVKNSAMSALLVVRKAGIDCRYNQVFTDCNMQNILQLDVFKELTVKEIRATSLTGVHDAGELQQRSVNMTEMEMKTLKIAFS